MTEVTGILDRVEGVAGELRLTSLRPQIEACRRQCNGHSRIDVAVFGRFKAGKSSFLNHLTGRAVLPIGVVPLTAVITRLRYGPVERAGVRFLDGTSRSIALDDIGRYVGENENPNNAKQVASVEVELPALEPLAPLEFVDTPGLGSAFTHNTEAAMKWLPNVGAALVAVSSDAPLSERDLALIEELRRHTPKIVLLLTKADLLTVPQRAEVLAFVRRQLQLRLIGSSGGQSAGSSGTDGDRRRTPAATDEAALPVFFYSVRPDERGLKAALEHELLAPLLQNRDAAATSIVRHKLGALLGATLDYLRVALAAATQAESARQTLRQSLAEERAQFDLLRAELGTLAREAASSALDGYLAQLHPVQQTLQGRVTQRLGEQLPRWRLRLPPLLAAWRQWLGGFLQAEMSEVSQTQQAMFVAPLHQVRTHLTRSLRAFHDRLADHVKSALGVTLAPHEFVLEVPEPTAPPVDVAFAFDAAFTTAGALIPATLFRRPLERVLLRKARYEVEKNLSRLAAGWRDRVARLIDGLTRDAEQQARDELAALEHTLAQTASNAPGLRQVIHELEHFQTRLRTE
jgi:GTP-binding protein EngB required for normal cell division